MRILLTTTKIFLGKTTCSLNMKEYIFNYRGGEIIATIKADSEEEAFSKCIKGEGEFEVQNWCLHYDMWLPDDENPSEYVDKCNE